MSSIFYGISSIFIKKDFFKSHKIKFKNNIKIGVIYSNSQH